MDAVRVLICDDDPDVRALYRIACEMAGATVEEASDGNEAIDVAVRFDPEIVVLDLNMPHRDGISAIRDLQESLSLDAKIYVVSAYLTVDRVKLALHLRATECFEKPAFLSRVGQLIADARNSERPTA